MRTKEQCHRIWDRMTRDALAFQPLSKLEKEQLKISESEGEYEREQVRRALQHSEREGAIRP